ncbi:MAG: anti-sigma regulatory factor [Syntrophomonas sp.]
MQDRDTPHEISISDETDVIVVRKIIRDAAVMLKFGLTDVTRIVTAASELGRNIFLYSGSGTVQWRVISAGSKIGMELVFNDSGPGIVDIHLAMEEGYSTSGGLGLGLPGSRRLMDEMQIDSRPGAGTRITVRKWQERY